MRYFVAGASGLIGVRLVPLLVAGGHLVAGLTRSPEKAAMLSELGAQPVVCDVYDGAALASAVAGFAPDVVVHQLTDLPDAAADLGRFGERNNRMRTEGTRNLVAAATAAGARVVAQSISWEHRAEGGRAATAAHEHAVLLAAGVVIRYGQFWGPGTYYEAAAPDPPRIHIDEAARRTVPALSAPPGLTVVVDDRATGGPE